MDERFDGHAALARVHALPGGRELIDLARGRSNVAMVGGAVRDLLLDRTPRELDVVVGDEDSSFDDAASLFAGGLASRLNTLAGTNEHERFGTALVVWDGGRIDVATRRAESYPAPGALPNVRAGTLQEDLLRRDFTVNAIAVALDGDRPGHVHAAPGALDDLQARRLRVLHDASFSDDPTRLLRLARYAARLGFQIEPHTAELAARAVAAQALDTVSGARIGAELRLALGEPDAVGALAAMDDLGLLAALHPRMRFDRRALERALKLLALDRRSRDLRSAGDVGRSDLLAMATLTLPLAIRAGDDLRAEILALLDCLEFGAADRDRVAAAAAAVPRLVDELPAAAERPSRLRAAVAGIPPEGIALAGAVSEPAAEPARRWFTELRNVHLQITGDDLLAAGMPEGPEIGRRLEEVLKLRLDGELSGGREAELQAALGV